MRKILIIFGIAILFGLPIEAKSETASPNISSTQNVQLDQTETLVFQILHKAQAYFDKTYPFKAGYRLETKGKVNGKEISQTLEQGTIWQDFKQQRTDKKGNHPGSRMIKNGTFYSIDSEKETVQEIVIPTQNIKESLTDLMDVYHFFLVEKINVWILIGTSKLQSSDIPSPIELTFQKPEGFLGQKKWKDQDNTPVVETLTYTRAEDRFVIKKHNVIRGTSEFERIYFDYRFKNISPKEFEPGAVLEEIKKEKPFKKDDRND